MSIEAGSDEIKCANKSRRHVFTLHLIATIRNRGSYRITGNWLYEQWMVQLYKYEI